MTTAETPWVGKVAKPRKDKDAERKHRREVKEKRKSWRDKGRAADKKIRSEDKPGAQRSQRLAASRVFHKTDKEGNPGGFKAFGEYAGRMSAQAKRKEKIRESVDQKKAYRKERKEKRRADQEARIAKRRAARDARRGK
jgi:hypothetical protein